MLWKKKEFKDKNTIIYGYSWDRPIIRENNLFENFRDHIDREKNNILILHGDIASSSDYLPLNLNKLKSFHMDYIALGHIHKPEILEE